MIGAVLYRAQTNGNLDFYEIDSYVQECVLAFWEDSIPDNVLCICTPESMCFRHMPHSFRAQIACYHEIVESMREINLEPHTLKMTEICDVFHSIMRTDSDLLHDEFYDQLRRYTSHEILKYLEE